MIILKPDWLRFGLTFLMQRFFMLPLVWVVFRWLNQVTVEGLEHFDEVEGESIIIAPNHTSAWDGFLATLWSLSHRKRYADHGSYTAVFAAPENIPTPLLKALTATLGAIPVDREQGVDQLAMSDTVRLFSEKKKRIILTCYPEGTRSKDGRLRRRGRPGIGWLQHQTKATVIPIYHVGGTRMLGLGIRMKVRIGAPLRFEHLRDAPDELPTWRAVTREIMESLREMEREALDQDPHAQPPKRRWRNRIPRRERPIAVRNKVKVPARKAVEA
ncbi:MAG: 1-acyl-sn-glycerol-3-phosphate acyltransferase [Planctomycetes bacterium]|nr:1-acyl-sn-glycerol-3-phosphate acyltransferase [Planctomycetota bacterium]